MNQALQKTFLFALVLFASPLYALTLENFLRVVWGSSGQLKGKADQSDIASNDRWRRFTPNEPQLWYIWQDNGGWQQTGINLTIPFPGRSLFFIGSDAKKARAAHYDYQATKLDLTKAAMDAFIDCASTRANYEIQERNLLDLQTFSRTLDRLYEQGHSTQAETLAAKLQLRQQESDLALTRSKLGIVCERLQNFTSQSFSSDKLELPDDLSSDLVGELGEESSDTIRAKAQKETAEAQSSTSIWQQLPDIQLSVFHNQYFVQGSSPVGLPETYSFQATMTIPLFFLFNEAPAARRASADARVQADQAELAQRQADSQRRQAAREYQNTVRRLSALDKEDIPLAEAMRESSFSAYRSGRLGFAELMLARRLYNDLRNQRLQLQISRLQLRLRCLKACEKETP